MKVILLKDVKSQGRKDDIINVSDGYANNYLIKNKLAVAYTETSKKILDKQIQIRNDEEAKIVANLTEIKNKYGYFKNSFEFNISKFNNMPDELYPELDDEYEL